MIMFTGSTATGKKVMTKAAETLTPVSLELGGKDPLIVLSDADLERAANSAVYWGMFNGGQTCISVERVYVEEPVYDEFVAKVTEKAKALRQGSGDMGTADVGSMTFPPQVDIVERHVEDAKAKGAKILVGGHRGKGKGYWFEPTVLVDVDHTMECMTEETFGPTLPIMKVADAEEAIRMANDSPYGLGASVYGKDVAPRRGGRTPPRVGCRVHQRLAGELHGARAAHGRCQGLRPRHASRCGRDPQVLPVAGDRGDAVRDEEGAVHVPLQGAHDEAPGPRVPPAVRARQARLATGARDALCCDDTGRSAPAMAW